MACMTLNSQKNHRMFTYNLTILGLGFALISAVVILDQYYLQLFCSRLTEFVNEIKAKLLEVKDSDDKPSSGGDVGAAAKTKTTFDKDLAEFRSMSWGEWNLENSISTSHLGGLADFVFRLLAWKKNKDKKIYPYQKRVKNITIIAFCIYIFFISN